MKNQKAIKVLFFSTFMALSRIFILKNRKATLYVTLRFFSKSRSDVIRTRDLYVPNVALYQAEPHSDNKRIWTIQILSYGKGTWTPTNRVRVCCAANYTIPHHLYLSYLSHATWLLYQTVQKNQELFYIFFVRIFNSLSAIVRYLFAI